MNKTRENHNIVKEIGFSLISEGKILKVKADGYSMYPAIKPGSVVLIEPLTENMVPDPGEIIAWIRESGFVVHRLTRMIKISDETMFITRGDSCAYEDQPVSKEQIAGKVISVETGSGKIKASGKELISKPDYLYNRLIVWMLIKIRRINKILQIDPPAPP
jgi:signal peptidase I